MKVKNVPLDLGIASNVCAIAEVPAISQSTCSHSLFFFNVISINDAQSSIFSSKLPFGNLKYYYKMVTRCIKIILATRTI